MTPSSKFLLSVNTDDAEAVKRLLKTAFDQVEVIPLNPLTVCVSFGTVAERDCFIAEKTIAPIADIQEELSRLVAEPSDINEHLHFLRDLAAGLHIVEFGCRNGVSTTALVSSAKSVRTYDIDPTAIVRTTTRLRNYKDDERSPGINGGVLVGVVGSTIDPGTYVPSCDLLFIDSLHTYTQLSKELEMHGNKAKKYLAFHDTITFGDQGEDGTTPGLKQAIDEFLARNPKWRFNQTRAFNNGVTVLERA